MSDCITHGLTFGRIRHVDPFTHLHRFADGAPCTIDFECPDCGQKLFVYARFGPPVKEQQLETLLPVDDEQGE